MDFHKILKEEREQGYPTIETLIQLNDIFNIAIDELLKGNLYLKNKIITGSKKLKYPKLKTFF